jgi:hypothetical protein
MALLDLNLKPHERQLASFGRIALVAFGLLGGWVWWRHAVGPFDIPEAAVQPTAIGLWIAAGLCGVLSFVAPRLLTPVFVGLTIVAFPIGLVISHTLMILLYYGMFTPIGVAMRLFGWDAMDRKIEKDKGSYWSKHKQVTDVTQYFKQY